MLRFSRAYLYYAYGAHVPFLCTSTYRTGDSQELTLRLVKMVDLEEKTDLEKTAEEDQNCTQLG